MSHDERMHQCRLRRLREGSIEEIVCWIPARGAKVGAAVELYECENPEQFWSVTDVYSSMLESTLRSHQQATRNSLPSIGKIT